MRVSRSTPKNFLMNAQGESRRVLSAPSSPVTTPRQTPNMARVPRTAHDESPSAPDSNFTSLAQHSCLSPHAIDPNSHTNPIAARCPTPTSDRKHPTAVTCPTTKLSVTTSSIHPPDHTPKTHNTATALDIHSQSHPLEVSRNTHTSGVHNTRESASPQQFVTPEAGAGVCAAGENYEDTLQRLSCTEGCDHTLGLTNRWPQQSGSAVVSVPDASARVSPSIECAANAGHIIGLERPALQIHTGEALRYVGTSVNCVAATGMVISALAFKIKLNNLGTLLS